MSGRATQQACPATSLVLCCLVLNWDQLAFCVLVFYKLDKANCRKFTTKCKAHIMKSVPNTRQKEKRERRETSLLQNAKRIIMESVPNMGQRKRDKEGKQVYYKTHNYGIGAEYGTKGKRQRREASLLQNAKCIIMESVQNMGQRKRDKEGKQVYYKAHNYGIGAEYGTKGKERKKENKFTAKCKAHMESVQNIRQRKKETKTGNSNGRITNLQTLFCNLRTGALSSTVATHCFNVCDGRHVILCDANQLPPSFSACGEFR